MCLYKKFHARKFLARRERRVRVPELCPHYRETTVEFQSKPDLSLQPFHITNAMRDCTVKSARNPGQLAREERAILRPGN